MLNFSKLPQKRCQGGRRRLHCQRPQSVFEEDEAKEAAEKKIKNQQKTKNRTKVCFRIFWNFPQKVPRGTPSTLSTPSNCQHCQRPQSVFEEDEAEEAAEKKINKKLKIWQKFVFLIFWNCPKKGAKGDAVYIVNALKLFLKMMEQKRPRKVHPPNVV